MLRLILHLVSENLILISIKKVNMFLKQGFSS